MILVTKIYQPKLRQRLIITAWARVLLEGVIFAQLVKKFHVIYGTEVSLPSPEPATGHYHDAVQVSSHIPTLLY
jgi:hypothetical protein